MSKDAVVCFAQVYFGFTRPQVVSHNMIFFSSQTQFFQKNWLLLSLLSIFELLVK